MAVNYDREKQELTRRNFLSLAGNTVAGVGIAGRSLGMSAASSSGRMSPTARRPSSPSASRPTSRTGPSRTSPTRKSTIIRHGNKIGAISMVCQHLGCTVAASATGYDCPCHGSKYDDMGNVTHGPALVQLFWFDISLTPSGDLEVDKSKKFQDPTGHYYTVA